MKTAGNGRKMSVIQTVSDTKNDFLSRREITCNFPGLGGKLQKTEAIQMVTAEYGLDDKVVIPIILKNQVGRTTITGTFYVYDDENLAKKHVDPTVFARLEKLKKKEGEAEGE